MQHDEAIRSQAAERYVAHELSPAEQNAFEEHFFDCRVCTDAVRFELSFAANVRAVSREQRQSQRTKPLPPGSLRKFFDLLRMRPATAFSLAGNLALAAALVFLVLPAKRPSTMARFTEPYFAPGPTHGAEDIHVIPPGDIYLVRFHALGAASQSYSFEIQDESGKRESSGSLSAPASQDDLYLQVPVTSLAAGVHTLVVRAAPNGEIASWSKFRTAH